MGLLGQSSRWFIRKRVGVSLIALALLFGSQSLLAATRTWTGNSINDPTPANRNNFWTNPLNWSSNVAPAADDDLVFPSTAVSQLTSINTFGAGTTFGSITIGNHSMTGAAIALNSGISATAGVISLNSIKLNNAQTFSVAVAASHNIASPIDTNGRSLTLQSDGTLVLSGAISGLGEITKTGSGTATLSANNSYSGITFARAGTFLVNGSQPASTIFIIGSTLGGTGTTGPIRFGFSDVASVIAPGSNGPGVLNGNNGVDFTEPATGQGNPALNIELNNTTVGTGYDQLNITGTVNLGTRAKLNVTFGTGFSRVAGDTFTIIKNDGTDAVVGTFQGLPEGATFLTDGTRPLVISYKGGDGNDVTLRIPATRAWDGGGADNNWMTAANWVGDIAPVVGDSLLFPAAAGQKVNSNNFPDGTIFDTVRIQGNGYSLTGNAITLRSQLIDENTDPTFSSTWAISMSGPGGVTNETGILRFFDAHSYTGPTVINSGELNVVNAFVTSSPMTLNGGRLTGQGDVGPITANSGTVEPTTNAVRVTGDINLSPQATFKTRAITTISGFLDVTGTVNLAGANLSIEVPTSNALALGGVRRIIVNDGTDPIVGTFNGLPEGAVFSPATDFFFRVSYTGGTGNDITITRVAPPTLAISDVTVTERNSGNTPATFAVTLSYPIANATVTFNFATAGGTAVPGSDFTAIVGGVLSFSPGTTSRTIVVQVNGDTVVEPDETFTVNLSSPVNATIADGQGICTILNDDGATSPTPTATPGGTATPSPTPGGTATPTPTPAKALNIATRLRVEKGDNVMIAGFIITGNASKDVVVRGMGPLLGAFGITDFLADPVLDLRGPAGSILKNNNWKDTQRTQIEGSPLEPGDDRESVIVASLAPDAYTAILTGNNDTTGVGLIEVYDNNAAADSQLGNISTRGLVQGSDSVMIGGFILGGSTNNSRIALRGIGPSLAQFGLNNVLANPTLELHDGNGALLISNDDWQTDTVSAGQLAANGLGLSDSKESGIFTSLPPGPFTAILAGKDGGIGIGLIEIYNLK